MEEQVKVHDKRAQQQREHQAADGATEATRVVGQLAGLGTEAMAVWGDVTQRAMRDVAVLSARTTQESVRQITQWQQMNMDLLREAQAAMFRWHTIWPEAFRDPIRYYQRTLEESIDVTRSLGETFREASSRMQDVYARSDRLRAA